MTSDEKKLEPMNDTLNPEPSRFGMPWYVILGILSLSVLVFLLPGCKIFGALLCPFCHRTLALTWPGEHVREPTSELVIDGKIERPSSKI